MTLTPLQRRVFEGKLQYDTITAIISFLCLFFLIKAALWDNAKQVLLYISELYI